MKFADCVIAVIFLIRICKSHIYCVPNAKLVGHKAILLRKKLKLVVQTAVVVGQKAKLVEQKAKLVKLNFVGQIGKLSRR